MKRRHLVGLAPLTLYLAAFTLIPVVSTLVLGLQDSDGNWGFGAFRAIGSHYQFGEAVVNTLVITGLGLGLELCLGLATALTLAGRFRAQGLGLSHLTMVLPVAAWVLTTIFGTIPRQVEEAASLDGCGRVQTLVRIVLPLALPGLVVGGLLAWLFSWEEFVLATYLTLGEKTMPLQVYYYLYQGNWFVTAVAAIVTTLLVLILSAFLQRYLQETSLAGAVR